MADVKLRNATEGESAAWPETSTRWASATKVVVQDGEGSEWWGYEQGGKIHRAVLKSAAPVRVAREQVAADAAAAELAARQADETELARIRQKVKTDGLLALTKEEAGKLMDRIQ
jgi:hypothetical protein